MFSDGAPSGSGPDGCLCNGRFTGRFSPGRPGTTGLPWSFGFGFDSLTHRVPVLKGRPFQLAAIAVLLACLPVTGLAGAATKEEKQAAARDRVERISAALGESRGEADAARAEADRSAAREAEYSDLISTGAERSAALGDRVDRAGRQLDASKKRLVRARKVLEQRLVSIYMSGAPDPVDLALGSGSFAELASTTTYLRSISDSDNRLAARVAELRADLSDRLASLDAARAAVDRHNAELEQARAGIAAARVAAEADASRLAALNSSREGEIAALKTDIDTWQRQIEREELKRQRQAEQAVDRQAAASEAEQQVAQNLGGPYSIPTYIVMCESGGNYSAVNPSSGAGGAYQIMPATWAAYGGKGRPQDASKAEQDRIAALIWADSGPGAWSCA